MYISLTLSWSEQTLYRLLSWGLVECCSCILHCKFLQLVVLLQLSINTIQHFNYKLQEDISIFPDLGWKSLLSLCFFFYTCQIPSIQLTCNVAVSSFQRFVALHQRWKVGFFPRMLVRVPQSTFLFGLCKMPVAAWYGLYHCLVPYFLFDEEYQILETTVDKVTEIPIKTKTNNKYMTYVHPSIAPVKPTATARISKALQTKILGRMLLLGSSKLPEHWVLLEFVLILLCRKDQHGCPPLWDPQSGSVLKEENTLRLHKPITTEKQFELSLFPVLGKKKTKGLDCHPNQRPYHATIWSKKLVSDTIQIFKCPKTFTHIPQHLNIRKIWIQPLLLWLGKM